MDQGPVKLTYGYTLYTHNELLGSQCIHGYLFMALISVGGYGYREMLIDDTSIWSSDDTRGAGRGSFTLREGWGHLHKQLLPISRGSGQLSLLF